MDDSTVTAVDVVVVGAGISGLATAWYIQQARPDWTVVVLEQSNTVGGKVASTQLELPNGDVPVDVGPDAFLARVPWATDLCNDLGIGNTLEPPTTGQAWIVSQATLRALPAGLVLGVPTDVTAIAQAGIVSADAVARLERADRSDGPAPELGEDPSIAEAIGAHLGEEVVDRLVDPLLGGINAGDSKKLSLSVVAPQLLAACRTPNLMRALRTDRQAAGSDVRAATDTGQATHDAMGPVFLRPRGGMRILTDTLAARVTVLTNTAAVRIEQHRETWEVASNEHRWLAPHVVITTPAAATAALLRGAAPMASDLLDQIRYVSVALAVITYPRATTRLPAGSGMLVPRIERRLLTAASWWDQKWASMADPHVTLVRASVGRDGAEEALSLSDGELIGRIDVELRSLLGEALLASRPAQAMVRRWVNGFPQFDVGHTARIDALQQILRTRAPGIELTGAAYRGVGLATCIREARACAERVTTR